MIFLLDSYGDISMRLLWDLKTGFYGISIVVL